MNYDYQDIRILTDKTPSWFDENAVPRYCKFSPNAVANIYATQCCLLLIECQGCGLLFEVAISYSKFHNKENLENLVKTNRIHYGDPPNVGCCDIGLSMNSIPKKILEFWYKESGFWSRNLELEIEVQEELWQESEKW